jgi:hypothetical protein
MNLLTDNIMIIGIPREYHKTLSKWAEERNLKNPDCKASAEIVAVEVICDQIDRIERMEMALSPNYEQEERKEKSEQ